MQIKRVDIQSNDFKSLTLNDSVFLSFEWIMLFDNHQFYTINDNDDTIIGGFVVQTKRVLGQEIIQNLPYTPNISLFFNNKSKNFANNKSNEKHLISLLSGNFKSNLISKFAFPVGFNDLQPFIWDNYKVIPNYTYRIDLNQELSSISAKMSPQRRNELKKAEKDGVVVKRNYDNNLVLEIINKTFDRKKLKVSSRIINKILFEFANNENSFSFIAYKDELPIAATFCIHDQNTVYYLLGGYDNFNKHQSAGALCVWNSIQLSKELNKKIFDFEGSMLKPVERYFRDFGGDLVAYYTVNKARFLIEIVLKMFKRAYF